MAKKTDDVRGRSDAELEAEVDRLREQLFKLRWQASSSTVENPNKIRSVRRSIARHLTVLGQRASGAPASGGTR